MYTSTFNAMADISEFNLKGEDSNLGSFYCDTTIELQNLLMSSVENVLSRVSDDCFTGIYKACFENFEKLDGIEKPSLFGSSGEARRFRKQFNSNVTQNISDNIDETLTGMDKLFKYVEELKKDQTDTSFTWRPPGDAIKHIAPFDVLSKLKEKREIQNKIEREREAVDLLKARLIQKRMVVKNLYDTLQMNIKSIEDIVTEPVAEES